MKDRDLLQTQGIAESFRQRHRPIHLGDFALLPFANPVFLPDGTAGVSPFSSAQQAQEEAEGMSAHETCITNGDPEDYGLEDVPSPTTLEEWENQFAVWNFVAAAGRRFVEAEYPDMYKAEAAGWEYRGDGIWRKEVDPSSCPEETE